MIMKYLIGFMKEKYLKNKIPRFSKYYKKRKMRLITEEDAQYNAIKVCNLPFGLLQKIYNYIII